MSMRCTEVDEFREKDTYSQLFLMNFKCLKFQKVNLLWSNVLM